ARVVEAREVGRDEVRGDRAEGWAAAGEAQRVLVDHRGDGAPHVDVVERLDLRVERDEADAPGPVDRDLRLARRQRRFQDGGRRGRVVAADHAAAGEDL